jgi:radical SAM protein with 4Fe4S-binding SPASM domain
MKLPSYLQLEPVGQCNLRCQMCPIQFRKDGPPHGPPAFMPFETFTGIVDQFNGLEELHLQGLGEPMMHPRFFDMVAYAVRRKIRVTTNSNLTILNPTRAERCITSGLDTICVSIDGATPEIYEAIRIRGHLDRVLGNIRLIAEARRRLDTSLPHFRMVTVVMKQNLHELPDLVRLARQCAMEAMFVQHLCHDFGESSLPGFYRPMRDFVQDQTLLAEDPARIEHYFEEARLVARKLNIDLRLPRTSMRIHAPETPGRDRCQWPWTGAYISYDGHAMPCCMIATPDRFSLGNVHTNTADEIWSGSAYEDFRGRLASPEPPEICKSCSVYCGTF